MAAKRRRLPVWTVRWYRSSRNWVLWGRDEQGRFGCQSKTKRTALLSALVKLALRPPSIPAVSLRIFRKNGTIQEERTYPRSADPRRSRG